MWRENGVGGKAVRQVVFVWLDLSRTRRSVGIGSKRAAGRPLLGGEIVS